MDKDLLYISKGGGVMERLTREMTFEEEYTFLKKEVKELFDKEDRKSEPPESHCIVRRALRCIKKLVAELEPYKEYKDLEEQGLLLRLPTEAYFIKDNIVRKGWVQELVYSPCRKLLLDIRYDDNSLDSYRGYVGNTVFLTQAEAEQQLKEMESESE